jgi:hypothetical protein
MKMKDQDILYNAPDGATHVETADDGIFYYKKGEVGYSSLHVGEWCRLSALTCYVRSLSDIRKIAELESKIKSKDSHILALESTLGDL